MIPLELLHDFGGDGPILHLGHANGFPPGTYRPLVETLTRGDGYHVIAMPLRPLWPGSKPQSAPTWHPLANDLVRTLDALGLKGLVGAGHSLGGVCTMLAAIRRPDLFRALVLIEPVILPPPMLWALRLMQWLGLRERQPLVQGALRRRRAWPSRQTCFEHYRGKALFARWPDESLWAYVEAGTHPRGDGQVELTYPAEWEAHVFGTTPLDIWQHVPKLGRLGLPVLVIRGERSDTFRRASQARMERQLPKARFVTMADAGHLVPMERAEETGELIRAFLAGR